MFFGLAALLGVLWFADSLDGIRFVAGITIGISYVMVAFFPQHRLATVAVKRFVIALCTTGIFTGLFLAVIDFDFSPSPGIIFGDVLIRLLPIAALVVIVTQATRAIGDES